ncbi:uncharacterized protein LOC144461892 [Epinephelus lanceolatus]
MDLVWTILPVFLLCAEAQNLTVVKAELGQNTTLNCSVNITSIHWYVEIRSQVRGLIAETFTPDPNDILYHIYTTLKTKYIAMGNKLLITNITSEDHRFYFCATKKKSNVTFTDTFHLVSDGDITPPNKDCETHHHLQLHIRYISAITGLVFISLCLMRKNCNYHLTDPSPSTNENPETLETPQYEEMRRRDLLPTDSPQ